MITIIVMLLVMLADCEPYSVARWERADIFGHPVTCMYAQYELSGIMLRRHGW